MSEASGGDPRILELVKDAAADFVGRLGGVESPGLVAAIADAVEPVHVASGASLFEAGDTGDAAYFVVTGRLVVVIDTPDGEVQLRRLWRGSLIGEIALLDGSPRTAGIRAERDSLLARLPKHVFEGLAERFPDFRRAVVELVIGRLARPRPAIERVTTIAIASATRRVSIAELGDSIAAEVASVGRVVRLEAMEGSTLEMDRALDEAEAAHRFVLLPISTEMTPWDRRVLHHADRVLVVSDRVPTDGAAERIREITGIADAVCHGSTWIAVVDDDESDGLAPIAAGFRDRFGVERVVRIRPHHGADLERLARLVTGQGVGLVLGGGGARGLAHLGVVRVLEDLGIPVDAVAGSSIGSVFSASTALGLSRSEREDAVRHGFKRVLDYTFPSVGLVKARRLSRNLEAIFGDLDLQDLRLPCVCVSSNLTTARLERHETGPVVRAVRSSIAIPGVLPPVPHEGSLLVDAGVLNNLPIDVLASSGLVGTIIAVDVAPPVGPGARHDYGLSVSGWRVLFSALRRRRKRYPRLSSILLRSMIVGSMRERDRMVSSELADLYLDLDLRGISMLDFSRPEAAIAKGDELSRGRITAWMDERGGWRPGASR